MGPEVIVTDEIGGAADITAIEEVIHAGVTVVATAHGSSLAELRARPACDASLTSRYLKGRSYWVLAGGRGRWNSSATWGRMARQASMSAGSKGEESFKCLSWPAS